MRFLGLGDESKLAKAAEYIRTKQMASGGWAIFPDGPVDVSASVKAVFLPQTDRRTPPTSRNVQAREAIRRAGGVPAVNSYTKFYLAMLGQIPWHDCPAVPAELMLLPRWFYFNIYAISAWSRTFAVPLSIIWARKPVVEIKPDTRIDELMTGEERRRIRSRTSRPAFHMEQLLPGRRRSDQTARAIHSCPFAGSVVRRAEKWMVEHCEKSAGLGAIFPPIVYSLIALRSLGYPDDHPEVTRALEELRKLEIEDEETLRLEPCTSPVWDTAIAINALAETGIAPDHPAMIKAAEWLVSKEVRAAETGAKPARS